jgi:hypothetical protein
MFVLTTLNSGLTMVDPYANPRFVYPLLYAYVTDHQEGCKVNIHYNFENPNTVVLSYNLDL